MGDEGGSAPTPLTEAGLNFMMESIQAAGVRIGTEIDASALNQHESPLRQRKRAFVWGGAGSRLHDGHAASWATAGTFELPATSFGADVPEAVCGLSRSATKTTRETLAATTV